MPCAVHESGTKDCLGRIFLDVIGANFALMGLATSDPRMRPSDWEIFKAFNLSSLVTLPMAWGIGHPR